MSPATPRWARLDFSRVRNLGAQRRHAMANAMGSISDLLEVFGRASPEAQALVEIIQEGIATIFIETGLENAMGSTNTDHYGVVRDIEIGRPVGYFLKWTREAPRLRIAVPITREQAIAIEVRVDLHRAAGHQVKVQDLFDLLSPPVYEDMLAETDGIEQAEMLAGLARALDVQSLDRVEVLTALIQHGHPATR